MMSPLYAILFIFPAVCMAIDLKPYNVTAHAMFKESDYNGDGVMTKDELDKVFKGYDVNGDGRVTRAEYTSFTDSHTPTLHALAHALYDIYDVNKDHHLDHHDYANFFSLMDSDANNIVSESEFIRYWSILFVDLEHVHGPQRPDHHQP